MQSKDLVTTFTQCSYWFNVDSVPTIDVQISRRLLGSLQLALHSTFTDTVPNFTTVPAIITFREAVMEIGHTRVAWPPIRRRCHLWRNNRGLLSGGGGKRGEDRPGGQEEVKLLVSDLKEVLRVKLDRRVPREVQDALNKAAVLADDIEGEAAALEVVENPRVVARDIHPPTKAGEIHIHCGFLAVAAQHDRVGLHVVLEILALQLREPRLHFAITDRRSGRHRGSSTGGGLNVGQTGFS